MCLFVCFSFWGEDSFVDVSFFSFLFFVCVSFSIFLFLGGLGFSCVIAPISTAGYRIELLGQLQCLVVTHLFCYHGLWIGNEWMAPHRMEPISSVRVHHH